MAATAQTAQTAQGPVQGSAEDGLIVYRGIPFAAPPVGELRFRAPQPAAAWDGVREAQAFSPVAPQLQMEGLEQLLPSPPQSQSEDCLYLNVWTPGLDAAARPVMVWIHGGGFIAGSGSEPLYDGRHLAARGDVVVVSFNYRLGPLGCLNDPQLAEINLGIRDQVAALEWVRENIASFGGDPDQVTIFGESSGGHSVSTLLAVPKARGLFRGAIAQSPDPNFARHRETTAMLAERVYQRLGVAPRDLEAMRAISVADLLAAQQEVDAQWFEEQYSDGFTGEIWNAPIVDGDLMPRLPIEVLRDGGRSDVALMIGTTADEFKLFRVMFPLGDLDAAAVAAQLDAVHEDGRHVYDVYRESRASRGEAAGPQDIFEAALADATVVVPALRIADAHADAGGRTYGYVFDWKSPLLEGELGACHAIDLPFTFGTQSLAEQFVGSGAEVDALAAAAMDAWIAFARHGDPSTESLSWPRYDSQSRAQMILSGKPRMESNWRGAEQAVWPDPF